MARAKKTKNEAIKSFSKLEKLSQKLSENTEETNKIIEKARNKSKNLAEKCFYEGVKLIFENHPKLERFSWNQYTPHWNDGDECTFGANTDSLNINGEECEEYAYNLRDLIKKLNGPDLEKEKEKLKSKLSKIQNKEDWEYRSTEQELKNLDRSLEEVSEKLSCLEDIGSILNNLDGETYKEMFGDHVTVIVTKNSVFTEEYEHD